MLNKNPLFILLALPSLIGYGLAWSVLYLAFGHKLKFADGVLSFELRHDSWFAKSVYRGWAATSFGPFIMFAETCDYPTVRNHELVHVRQLEDDAVAASWFALGILPMSWQYALCVWCFYHPFALLGTYWASVLRGGNFYFDAAREQAARDRSNVIQTNYLHDLHMQKVEQEIIEEEAAGDERNP